MEDCSRWALKTLAGSYACVLAVDCAVLGEGLLISGPHFLMRQIKIITPDSREDTASSTTWRRQWNPIPGLLPGKSHGRRSLVGCSPWGLEELDTTE